MFSGIYSNASAMEVTTRQHEVVANNLANANMPGFRRTLLAVSTRGNNIAESGQVDTDLRGSRLVRSYVDFSQGGLNRTMRPLDVAINGDGFFSIEGPDGERFTRNGSFQITSEGQLVTADGLPVSGQGGPINIPKETSLSDVIINADGTIRANGAEIGQLKLVTFEDLDSLQQTGPTQFKAPDSLAAIPSTAVVAQGSLESGNASIVAEMVAMIVGMRHFEAAQQSLRSISEAVQQFTTLES